METVALQSVDLEVFKGEFLALAGAAGSGKSSLVQHINGLLMPTSGRVRVLGKDTADKKHREELWRRVGLVFQFPERQIFGATVFEDVAFGVINAGLNDTLVSQRVNEALDMVDLPEEIKYADPNTLSSGMMRRVAIAGILAMQPEVLILDEPGAGLEPAAKKSILSRLKNLQMSHRITLILITHHLDDAAIWADRVALLNHGRLLALGKTDHILTQIHLLQEAGLKPPYAVDLASRLADENINLPEIPLTLDDAARVLCKILQPLRLQ